tara:strand:- start:177 stop:683 length:507 start_codon:yes stop_codon:yes gene_type:complete
MAVAKVDFEAKTKAKVKRKPKKKKATSEEFELPLNELKRVALLSPSLEELAFVFDVSVAKIEKELDRPEIQQQLELGRGGRRLSLKRAQWKAAMGGNTAMLIWLGKNDLQQSDKGGVADDAVEMATKITVALKEMQRRTANTTEGEKDTRSSAQMIQDSIDREEDSFG